MHTEAPLPSADLARAVGALLQADPARIKALAYSLRAPGRQIESRVEGMSMGRGLPAGSRIRIGLAHQQRYEVGTVIAYLAGSKVVVHRVAHRGLAGPAAEFFLTRGDAPLVPDPPVAHSQILGPVIGVLQGHRWVEICDAPRRTLHARIAASMLLQFATALLYLSPRATSSILGVLHRSERAVQRARARLTFDRRRQHAGRD